jgi:hypothetical protein
MNDIDEYEILIKFRESYYKESCNVSNRRNEP